MGAFSSLFVTLFSGLASFFGAFVTKKIAFAAAAIASFGVLTVGLYAVLAASISGLVGSFPVSGVVISTFLWVALPPQVPLMVAGTIAADTAIALYRWNVENVRLATSAT